LIKISLAISEISVSLKPFLPETSEKLVTLIKENKKPDKFVEINQNSEESSQENIKNRKK
jgi:methionyl-tRNA synthetase